MHRLSYLFLVVLCGCAAAATGKGGLDPKIYQSDYDTVYSNALLAVQEKGWTIEFTDRDTGLINAKTGVNLATWGDTVAIRVIRQPENKGVRVDVSSRTSGNQIFDWGKNTSNIKGFFTELDKLMSVPETPVENPLAEEAN